MKFLAFFTRCKFNILDAIFLMFAAQAINDGYPVLIVGVLLLASIFFSILVELWVDERMAQAKKTQTD